MEHLLGMVGRFKKVCINFRRHYVVRILDGKRMYDGRCNCKKEVR